MGRLVNKSFNKVRSDISRRIEKLEDFFMNVSGFCTDDKFTQKEYKYYMRLYKLCVELLEEIENLDEVEQTD